MKKLLAVILAALVLAGLFGVQAAYAKPGHHSVPACDYPDC